MQQWLSANKDSYEFYVLHALYNDPVRRLSLLGFPLEPSDFSKDEHLVLMAAFKHAHRVMSVMGNSLPSPITLDFMRSYINSATRSEDMDKETQAAAEALMVELENPAHSSQWYCIEPYFEAWITTVRGKRYARAVQMSPVADMPAMVAMVQRDIAAAAAAMSTEKDEMADVMDGESTVVPLRRSTGILGLDACLNGGWGAHECYLLFGGTGGGKCHGAGTPILMHDGSIKAVEDVEVGDQIMGPDSLPRRVTELVRGRDRMFRIVPHRGAEPVVVNSQHKLTLAVTNIGDRVVRSAAGVEARSHELIDVQLDDYLSSSGKFRHVTKWVQAGPIEFPATKKPEITPYLFGFWLGGDEYVDLPDNLRSEFETLWMQGNKHVPQHYLTGSLEDRALLLAGLLDSDGSVHRSGWDFSSTNKQIAESVVFLARSLGHSASPLVQRVTTCQTGASCTSWRTHISPTSELPTRIKKPEARRQTKNPLTNGFNVEPLGPGEYFGFSVEGPDRRYLLGDFSITHNSIAAAQCGWHEANNGGHPLIVSTELRAREYVVRMVSNAVSIPINLIQDCENFTQIRQAVAMQAGMAFKTSLLETVLQKIRERVRVAKIGADDGLDARATLEREVAKYRSLYGVDPTWVCLDWLGTMADVGGGAKGTSERAMLWETSASSCVRFADVSGIPTLVLAQAVNNAQRKHVLAIDDIGISKGIGKNMVAVIGVTNTINDAEVKAAIMGKTDLPSSMTLPDQLFCVCKARKGEGANIQVRREFKYQRFECKPKK